MTLQQLRYVTAVADTGTISRAAQQFYISQPSLTNSIRELEQELGLTIFHRTNRGVALTPEGEEFLGYARQVLLQAQLLEERYGARSLHKQQFSVSAQHYNFAARVFAGVVRELGGELLPRLFEKNPYMNEIYPDAASRSALTVFVIYEGIIIYYSEDYAQFQSRIA